MRGVLTFVIHYIYIYIYIYIYVCVCVCVYICNSPNSDETVLTVFYYELSSLAWHITKHNNLIIGVDINVQIGKMWKAGNDN